MTKLIVIYLFKFSVSYLHVALDRVQRNVIMGQRCDRGDLYNFHRTLAFVKGIREVHEAKKEVFELWWNRTQHRPDKSYRCSVNRATLRFSLSFGW